MAEMIVQIGADVQPAIAGITQVGNKLGGLPAKVAPATEAMSRFSEKIRATVPAGQSFGRGIDQASDKLKKSSTVTNTASQSLLNFSRVAQDAPFGILGIANNLNPLFESLQRTSAAAKEAGQSLGSALKGALTGPAGIGLAIGVASSLLITFGDKLFGATVKLKEAEIAAAAFSKSLQDVSERLEETKANLDFGTEIANLQAQLSGLKGPNLKFATDANSVANAVSQIGNIDKELEGLKKTQADLTAQINSTNSALGAFNTSGSVNKLVKSFSEGTTQLDVLIRRFGKFEAIPKELIEKLDKNGQGIVTKLTQTNSKIKELAKQREEALRRTAIGTLSQIVDIQEIKEEKEVKADKIKIKPSKVEFDFSLIGDQLRLQVPVEFEFLPTFKDIRTVILGGDIKSLQEQAQDAINNGIEKLAKPFTLNLSVDAKLNLQKIEGLRALNEQLNKAISDGIQNINLEGLSSIGDAIGEAISGGDIQDAFSRFGQTVGTALQGIGRQIISIGVAALLAKKALEKLFANPAIAIAAGVALVAAGGALKNVLSGGVKARKKGGPVKPGEPYLVGEEGPEIVSFERNGVVIPAPKTKRILQETDTVLPGIAPFDKVTAALPKREFGGPVLSNMRYIVGEKGGELYVPFASGSISRNKPSGLSGAFASSQETQYIPMIKNGELGLLIKRAEKFLGRNS